MSEETQNKLIFVGYTNGYQVLYASEAGGGEGAFYSNTDNDCYIPLYMLKSHADRLQSTSNMNVTLEKLNKAHLNKSERDNSKSDKRGLLAGDHVLATKWSDGDPKDHWCVGFYKAVLPKETKDRHEVVDGDGNLFRGNGFRRVKKISQRRGEFILSKREQIENSRKSLWWWLRQPLDS